MLEIIDARAAWTAWVEEDVSRASEGIGRGVCDVGAPLDEGNVCSSGGFVFVVERHGEEGASVNVETRCPGEIGRGCKLGHALV